MVSNRSKCRTTVESQPSWKRQLLASQHNARSTRYNTRRTAKIFNWSFYKLRAQSAGSAFTTTCSGCSLLSSVFKSLMVLLVLNVLARLLNSGLGVPGLDPLPTLPLDEDAGVNLAGLTLPVVVVGAPAPSMPSISLLLRRLCSPVLPLLAVLHLRSRISASGFVITLLRLLLLL